MNPEERELRLVTKGLLRAWIDEDEAAAASLLRRNDLRQHSGALLRGALEAIDALVGSRGGIDLQSKAEVLQDMWLALETSETPPTLATYEVERRRRVQALVTAWALGERATAAELIRDALGHDPATHVLGLLLELGEALVVDLASRPGQSMGQVLENLWEEMGVPDE